MLDGLFIQDGYDTILFIKVKTRQQDNRIELVNQRITVYVKDPPLKGKANKNIVKMLKKKLKTEITLESGHTNKNKVFRVHNLTPNQVQELLLTKDKK